MDKRRVRVFRDKLLDRRESLVGQVQPGGAFTAVSATRRRLKIRRIWAANAYTKNCWYRCRTTIVNCLNLIDEALVRMDDSGYGKCIRCGQAVPEKRLEAVPWGASIACAARSCRNGVCLTKTTNRSLK
jgi:DnaK suppressor protein